MSEPVTLHVLIVPGGSAALRQCARCKTLSISPPPGVTWRCVNCQIRDEMIEIYTAGR